MAVERRGGQDTLDEESMSLSSIAFSLNGANAKKAFEEETPKAVNFALLVFGIVSYSATSLAVVYFNKWLFHGGFQYPVFISWLQQVIGFIIFLSGSFLAWYFQRLRVLFPAPVFHKALIYRISPLTASFVLMVAGSNMCLKVTQISTYQVARSLTLLFVLILSYVILKERQTSFVLVACGLMVAGFAINSLDPKTLTIYGLIFGGVSSFFQALYNVLIKFTLPAVENNNQLLLFYNTLVSAFLFIPVVLATEGLEPFRECINTHSHDMRIVWGGIFISGLLGTLLNMTQYLLINTTTPLSFNMVGFCKSIVQSVGGIIFMGDAVTLESFIGISLSTIGSGVYIQAKRAQQLRKEELNEFDSSRTPTGTLEALEKDVVVITPSTVADPPRLA